MSTVIKNEVLTNVYAIRVCELEKSIIIEILGSSSKNVCDSNYL